MKQEEFFINFRFGCYSCNWYFHDLSRNTLLEEQMWIVWGRTHFIVCGCACDWIMWTNLRQIILAKLTSWVVLLLTCLWLYYDNYTSVSIADSKKKSSRSVSSSEHNYSDDEDSELCKKIQGVFRK
jgi:hypothetical protein